MGALYEVDNLGKSYRRKRLEVRVFDGLNLRIEEGEFVAIMGPSGSGKTTLLNILSGIDRPTEGSLKFCGYDIGGLRERSLTRWRARNIGLVFQFYNLIPVLTASQNIEVPLLLTSLTKHQRRERVETVLELTGLQQRAGHLPEELSGGQQQRVAIARAIIADPSVIICDEPTGDLDSVSTREVMSIIEMLNRHLGKSVILVTHDVEVADYADRTLHMDKDGKLTTAAAVEYV